MSTVLASGFQEISREWWSLAQNRLKTNLELSNKLLSCRTVPEALSVQSELAKCNLEQFLNDTRRLMELSMNAMGKMASHAEANMERATDQARRAA
jgi:phasin family protein